MILMVPGSDLRSRSESFGLEGTDSHSEVLPVLIRILVDLWNRSL